MNSKKTPSKLPKLQEPMNKGLLLSFRGNENNENLVGTNCFYIKNYLVDISRKIYKTKQSKAIDKRMEIHEKMHY